MKICDFDIPVSIIAFKRAWRDSVGQFVAQVGRTVDDVITRTQEIRMPQNAYFNTPIERRINLLTGKEDLYWQGYKRSIDESMRRNIAVLIVHGESQEKIDQAKAERQLWQSIRDQALGLNEGEAIRFFGLRTINPEEGISLQQLSMRNGQLVLESLLLPFTQANQIDSFWQQLDVRGEDISLPNSGEVNPFVLWAVQGEMLDFKQDVPEMIDQVMLPAVPETIPEFTPLIYPTVMPVFESVAVTPNEAVIPVGEVTGFWFEVMADALNTDETQIPEFEAVNTSGSEPEATDEALPEMPINPKPDSPGPESNGAEDFGWGDPPKPRPDGPNGGIRQAVEPTRSLLVGKEVKKDKLSPAAVELSKPQPTRSNLEVTSIDRTAVLEDRIDVVLADPPTKTVFVGKENNKPNAAIISGRVPEVVFRATEPPVYEVNDREIPFWQPTLVAVSPDYTILYYIVTLFFTLLNTNMVQLENERGSGQERQRAVVYAS